MKNEIKEDKKFHIMDHILDDEIEPFIILLSENDYVSDSWDEIQ